MQRRYESILGEDPAVREARLRRMRQIHGLAEPPAGPPEIKVFLYENAGLGGGRRGGGGGGTSEDAESADAPNEAALPTLEIEPHNLPDAARRLADLLREHPRLFDRGGPVELRRNAALDTLEAVPLTEGAVTARAHEVCRPTMVLRLRGTKVYRPATLPARVARIYLEGGHWNLRPLRGIAATPLLSDDGTIRSGDGYDVATGFYCESCPAVAVPDRPSRADAEAALQRLRAFFRTWPFADAHRDGNNFVSLAMPAGRDESAALVALLTAVCRPSLPSRPGSCCALRPLAVQVLGKACSRARSRR